jgi:hypothetical protein
MKYLQDMTIKEVNNMLQKWREGEVLQWRKPDTNSWLDIADDTYVLTMLFDCNNLQMQIRVKPRMVAIEARKIPAPETNAPPEGTLYYMPVPHRAVSQEHWTGQWSDKGYEYDFLRNGLVYLNKEDAMKAAKAMLPLLVERA